MIFTCSVIINFLTQAESQRASLEKQMRESVDKAKKDVGQQLVCLKCKSLVHLALI